MRKSRRQKFADNMEMIHTEGQGVFRIEIVRITDVPGLLLATIDGNVKAQRTASIIGQFIRMMAAGSSRLCLLCDNEVSDAAPPWAIVIMTAERDDPERAIANGVCDECAEKPDLDKAIVVKYRESLMPGLRVLGPFSDAGRA